MINCSIAMKINPLKKEDPKRAYACAQTSRTMDLNQFAEHIASHGSVYSRADIAAVLTLAVDYMRENLLDGVLIKLGDLGDFSVSIQSIGAESAAAFKTDTHIVGVSVNWTPGERFANLLADATFNVVPSRKIARKILKAIKAGDTQVDFTEEIVPGIDDDTDTGTDTGGSDNGDASENPMG